MMARNLIRGLSGVSILSPNHPDLLAFWKLDETTGATVAVDSSPNAQDGAITSTTFVAGHIGNAANFDGVDDVIMVPVATIQTAKSFSGWGYTDGVTANFMINTGTSASGINYWTFMALAGGQFLVDSNNGSAQKQFMTTATFATATFHHFVVQDNGATTGIYINGVLQALTNNVGTDTGRFTDEAGSANNGSLGAAIRSPTAFRKGRLDQVRPFNRALTQAEITTLAAET